MVALMLSSLEPDPLRHIYSALWPQLRGFEHHITFVLQASCSASRVLTTRYARHLVVTLAV